MNKSQKTQMNKSQKTRTSLKLRSTCRTKFGLKWSFCPTIATVFIQAMLVNLPVFVKYPFSKYIYSAPFGIMMLTLFFRIRVSFLFSFVLGLYISLIKGIPPEVFYIVPVISAFSSLFMNEVRNRYEIAKVGIYTLAVLSNLR